MRRAQAAKHWRGASGLRGDGCSWNEYEIISNSVASLLLACTGIFAAICRQLQFHFMVMCCADSLQILSDQLLAGPRHSPDYTVPRGTCHKLANQTMLHYARDIRLIVAQLRLHFGIAVPQVPRLNITQEFHCIDLELGIVAFNL